MVGIQPQGGFVIIYTCTVNWNFINWFDKFDIKLPLNLTSIDIIIRMFDIVCIMKEKAELLDF